MNFILEFVLCKPKHIQDLVVFASWVLVIKGMSHHTWIWNSFNNSLVIFDFINVQNDLLEEYNVQVLHSINIFA